MMFDETGVFDTKVRQNCLCDWGSVDPSGHSGSDGPADIHSDNNNGRLE